MKTVQTQGISLWRRVPSVPRLCRIARGLFHALPPSLSGSRENVRMDISKRSSSGSSAGSCQMGSSRIVTRQGHSYLFLRDGVVNQHQVCQPGHLGQNIQVRQLRNIVGRENQVSQVRDGLRNRRLNVSDPISRQQQRPYARRQGKVAQNLDIIIGEVD